MKNINLFFIAILMFTIVSCSKSNAVDDLENDNVPTRVTTDSTYQESENNDSTGIGGTIIDWETITDDITVTED